MNDYECYGCGAIGPTSCHHIIRRSKVKGLTKCEKNQVRLCNNCHYSLHHGSGHKLEERLRREFLNYLQINFLNDYIEYRDIKKTLNISDKPLRGMLKTVVIKDGEYERASLIRTLLGGYLLPEEEI